MIIISCSMTNLTCPPTLASAIVQDNANILAGIVLTQLISPGVGAVYGSVTSPTDMRTVQLATGARKLFSCRWDWSPWGVTITCSALRRICHHRR